MSDKPEAEERLPVSEERLSVHKRKVETGRVRIRTAPEEREQRVRETVASEEVLVETVPVGREVESMPEVRQEGDTWVFPVVEQVLVIEKRSILKEEVRVRRVRRSETVEQPVTLRSTRVIVERGEHTGNEIPESKGKETTMANRTLTALFDSHADADRAEQQLIDLGIPADSIHIMDRTTTEAARASGATQGLWGKVKNIFLPEQDRYLFQEGVQRGGAVLAAEVEEPLIDRAIAALQACNAVDLDQREAQWRSGGWTGRPAPADDTARAGAAGSVRQEATGSASAGATGSTESEEVIPVAEEELRIGKREIDRGGVRVRSYIIEEPVHESVRLRDEHVDVERRPVDRPAAASGGGELLQEQAVEMRETAEEPVVQKDTRVKEEVVVRKHADERVEQVDDTVRRTQVDVEQDGDRMPPPGPGTARSEPRQTPPRH